MSPEKQREYNRIYYLANCEKLKKQTNLWWRNNKDKVNEAQRKWREGNKERINANRRMTRATNKERFLEYQRKYSRTNRDKVLAKDVRYRVQKLRACPSWASKPLIHSFYRMARLFNLDVDHIVPIQSKTVCGLHVQHNLQLLTREENIRKGNRYSHDLHVYKHLEGI